MAPKESLQPFTNIAAFVAESLKSFEADGGPVNEITSQRILPSLIRILAALSTQISVASTIAIRESISTAISNALRLVSAPSMIATCLNLLDTDNDRLQIELYNLVTERLPHVNAETRSRISPNIQVMVKLINGSLSKPRSYELSTASLRALQSIIQTSVPEEMSLLLDIAPSVVGTMPRSGVEETCCKTLELLW